MSTTFSTNLTRYPVASMSYAGFPTGRDHTIHCYLEGSGQNELQAWTSGFKDAIKKSWEKDIPNMILDPIPQYVEQNGGVVFCHTVNARMHCA
jgi:hypothetical protein